MSTPSTAHSSVRLVQEPGAPLVPNHTLLRRIGKGSYGEVWLALDMMNRWTAIKLIRWSTEDDGHAYKQELRGLYLYSDIAGLQATLMPISNIGTIESEGLLYYCMELADDLNSKAPLRRPDLKQLEEAYELAKVYRPWTLSEQFKARGPLDLPVAVQCAHDLAEALELLHSKSLVHRDIKPSNIIFVSGRPKLADIGLVRRTDATIASFVGTMGFVPAQGSGTPSGDIYALGLVLYMMYTGYAVERFPSLPPIAPSWDESTRKARNEILLVHDKACDPNPKDRYRNMQQFREDLRLLLNHQSVLKQRAMESMVRQLRILLLILVPVVLGLFGLLLAWNWYSNVQTQSALDELERRQILRGGGRRNGWSLEDWQSVERAVRHRMDNSTLKQGVATLPGLDSHLLKVWPGAGGAGVAFSPDRRVITSGHGTHPASLILDGTQRVELTIRGEHPVAWQGLKPVGLAAEGASLVLRDQQTGEALQQLRLPPDLLCGGSNWSSLALSPDGLAAAAQLSGTNCRVLLFWRLDEAHLPERVNADARSLVFAPDGSKLAVANPDGSVQIYSTRPFQAHTRLGSGRDSNPAMAMAFGVDRRVPLGARQPESRWLLATVQRGTEIVIWDLTAGTPRAFCRGSPWSIESLAFSPDGVTLASAGRLGIRFWDVMSGKELLKLDEFHSSNTRGIAFDSTGSRFVAASTSESAAAEISSWELETDRGILGLRGLTAPVRKVSYSPDGKLLVGFSDEWIAAVWDAANGRLLHEFEVPSSIYADNVGRAFNASNSRLAITAGQSASVFDLHTGTLRESFELPEGLGNEIQFRGDTLPVVARVEKLGDPARPRRTWAVYELSPGGIAKCSLRQEDRQTETIHLVLSSEARRLIVLGLNKQSGSNQIYTVDLDSGRELWRMTTPTRDSWQLLRTDPAGKWCAYSTGKKVHHQVFDTETGRQGILIPFCLAISPSGNQFAISGSENHWILRDRIPGDLTPFGSDIRQCADTHTFSPDGSHFAWGCVDGTVFVADIEKVRSKVDLLRKSGRKPILQKDGDAWRVSLD